LSSERAEKQGTNVWPTFNISGMQMQTLIINDWSLLWSIEKLKKYILEPSQVSAYACVLTLSQMCAFHVFVRVLSRTGHTRTKPLVIVRGDASIKAPLSGRIEPWQSLGRALAEP
jgi:hypothetical protein